MIDNATGELSRVDDNGTRNGVRNVTPPGHSVVAIAHGQPVVLNTDAHTATTVDPSGRPTHTFDLGLRPDDTVSASGSHTATACTWSPPGVC
ncbi:hypothetical protein GCM10029964_076500 [Kibdelosporangium lantanae]